MQRRVVFETAQLTRAVPPNTCDSGHSARGISGGAALSALQRAGGTVEGPITEAWNTVEERRFSAALASLTKRALAPARGNRIHTYKLCLLGFGNVNRTLVRLLLDREQELRERHGISFRITGVASRRLGWIADADGLDEERAP